MVEFGKWTERGSAEMVNRNDLPVAKRRALRPGALWASEEQIGNKKVEKECCMGEWRGREF